MQHRYHWLGPLLASFRRKHPRVTVHVAVEATGAPVRALLDGRVDLAILIDPARESACGCVLSSATR